MGPRRKNPQRPPGPGLLDERDKERMAIAALGLRKIDDTWLPAYAAHSVCPGLFSDFRTSLDILCTARTGERYAPSWAVQLMDAFRYLCVSKPKVGARLFVDSLRVTPTYKIDNICLVMRALIEAATNRELCDAILFTYAMSLDDCADLLLSQFAELKAVWEEHNGGPL